MKVAGGHSEGRKSLICDRNVLQEAPGMTYLIVLLFYKLPKTKKGAVGMAE